MTGTWKFQLTHGQYKGGQFLSANGTREITASSSENGNLPSSAFDGLNDTRWCASSGDYPQWLQADLGGVKRVTGADLGWENAGDSYECRIEGRIEGGAWQVLADASAAPGVGNGPVALTAANVRYVRVLVLKNSSTHWASLREFKILTTENGKQVAWRPPVSNENTPEVRDAFISPGFNDAKWDNIPVPSNWEVLCYSLPTYGDVDDTAGLYRRTVSVPKSWTGKRIYWHFDGAFDGTEIWVNGQKAGYHESGYSGFNVELTGLIKPGERNLFALRVSKTTPSRDADTGDFQSLGGIYRDTSLIAVPETHVQDITVQTPLSANYRDATLQTQVQVVGTPGQAVTLKGSLVGSDGKATSVQLSGIGQIGSDGKASLSLSAPVTAPRLWSAEKPNLYYVVLELSGGGKRLERVEQRFGFKQIELKNNIVLWNGRAIKCTGICRHDFWADKGYALTEANWVKDLDLMKAANINAIRTSHYNHAQRFIELCDERGMYLLDEVPYCWVGDGVKNADYLPFLVQRAQETLARDKNSPSVLAWSLGNENGYGINSQILADMVRQTDPTRPVFASWQNPDTIKGQAWQDSHYPDPAEVDRMAKNPNYGATLTEHPHTFYEKEVQDYDPGMSDLWSEVMTKTWKKLWQSPTILGSFVWEWQNQGIADKNPDTTTGFIYGPNRLRQENNKGVVDAYRNPKPEWWIVKTVYSPVVIGVRTVTPSNGTFKFPITNHYSFTDLNELTCNWSALKGSTKVQSGTTRIACGPMQTVDTSFPAPAGTTTLRLEFLHPDGTSIIAYNLATAGTSFAPPPQALTTGDALIAQDGTDQLTIHNSLQQIAFDKHSGTIGAWRVDGRDRLRGGPTPNLGEARGKNKGNDDNGIYRAAQPPVTTDAQVTVTTLARGVVRVAVTSTVLAAPDGAALGTLESTYEIKPNAEITVNWALNWTAENTRLWESGLKMSVPNELSTMRWQRDSYFTDYPAGHIGEPSGTTKAGDVSFRASKRDLHWLTLSDSHGAGLALIATGTELIARANANPDATTLFASHELAGDYGLSRQGVDEHDIHAVKGKSLSGSFILRAINGV